MNRGNFDLNTEYTQNRELSWLKFNERVLEEASDPTVPLAEKMKFVEIFTNNLDEFFMIRVGSLSDMALVKEEHIDNKTGMTSDEQLQAIFKACAPLYKERDRVYKEVDEGLKKHGICRVTMDELKSKERKLAEGWMQNQIIPMLSPQIIDMHHPFPHLASKQVNIILRLGVDGSNAFGIIPIPKELPLFLPLEGPGIRFVLLEDVMLEYADKVFRSVKVKDKAVFSITRNADIAPEDEAFDVDEDYRQLMRKVIHKRFQLAPVRLEIQNNDSSEIQDFLCKKLKLGSEQVFHTKAPVVLKYIYQIIDLFTPEQTAALCEPPYSPRWPGPVDKNRSLITQVLEKDIMLFYPYESMEPFLQMVREAAGDPDVVSIKITIYRLAAKAKLVEYLCAAAENGKSVTVLMELRARFDEQNNILWAERLEEAGCAILYGTENIKVHSKVCLITRKSKKRLQYITQVGTGNYHEKTAGLYTDVSLMTADETIGSDAVAFFQDLAMVNLGGIYKKLLNSPLRLRDNVMALIDQEIEKKSDGYIFLKLNSLSDRKIIDKLVEASMAGVRVDMNIRGICCLRPGVKGYTENIRVFSIVGRFLEHTRIYCFGKDEGAKMYISSADFMTRNTERRVEIACPVEDADVRKKMFAMIEELKKDNVKARNLEKDGTYSKIAGKGEKYSCQLRFMMMEQETPTEAGRRAPESEGLIRKFKRWFTGQ